MDSFNSETGKFTCISGASAPKGGSWRNAPRGVNRAESTIPDIKKKTPHLGVPIRDYKKTKIILMGTPASAS